MRTPPRTLLAVLLAATLTASLGAGAPVWAEPPAGKVSPEALRDTLAGLTARGAPARMEALGHLDSLLSVDPAVGLQALSRLRGILRLRRPAEVARVLGLLVRIPDKEARALWLARLDPAEEPDDRVLAAAVASTRQVRNDAAVLRLLLAAVREKAVRDGRLTPARRAVLLEALGHLESPAVDLLLLRPRAGEHWVEASARALALGHRAAPSSVPALLAILDHKELAPRVHAWESLVRLTHRNFPAKLAPWKAWWAKQDNTKLPARPAPPQAGKRYATKKPVHVPHYYDIPIPRPGSHVVFCLDASQSMYGPGIEQARRELTKTIMDLPSAHAFEIVVFNEKVLPWAKRLVRAHPVQKHLAIEHLKRVEPTSYTNLYGAVEMAFRHAGRGIREMPATVELDAIFLLSDGAPNRGQFRSPERVVKHIARMAKRGTDREIPVHTIGAGEEVFPLLRAIARETGGTFVDAFD